MQVAQAWGLTPREWDVCSMDDKAEMMGKEIVESKMARVEIAMRGDA